MPLLEPETMTLGDTTFIVGCLPATTGWDLSAKVANLLGNVNVPGTVVTADLAAATLAAVRALAAVPAAQLKDVRGDLFAYVEFTNARATTPQKLAGAEEMAFNAAGLSSMDIWKVFATAFRVNFTEYWEMMNSLLPGLQNMSQFTRTESPDL